MLATQIILLKLLATGITLNKTAEKLGVKYNTVKTRTRLLYKKFNVNNRMDLLCKALEHDWISIKDLKNQILKKYLEKNKLNIKLLEPLSKYEINYLKLAALGKTIKEIIEEIPLASVYHARYIICSICYKLNSKNITQAVYYAKYLKLI